MTAHRSQSTPTSASAAIPQWTGTPAEWDAERDRRAQNICKLLKDRGAFISMKPHDIALSYTLLATATMPPRPVEPPFTCEQCGVTDGDVYRFLRHYGHLTAESCREALKRELRALRDGPAPRYEVCGWARFNDDGKPKSTWETEHDAFDAAKSFGGTAHAIYRRVEGDK